MHLAPQGDAGGFPRSSGRTALRGPARLPGRGPSSHGAPQAGTWAARSPWPASFAPLPLSPRSGRSRRSPRRPAFVPSRAARRTCSRACPWGTRRSRRPRGHPCQGCPSGPAEGCRLLEGCHAASQVRAVGAGSRSLRGEGGEAGSSQSLPAHGAFLMDGAYSGKQLIVSREQAFRNK